jgi:hypothetical protein
MDINYIEELITCPISQEIFKDPVIADDGITYENKYIWAWLEYKNTSPITRAKITINVINNVIMKTLVNDYLTLKNSTCILNYIKKLITCPISQKIFKDPVIADDGITYEKEYILKWLQYGISPITKKKISVKLIDNISIKSLVNEYLLNYPGIKYINNKKFNKLLKYSKFDLSSHFFENLVENCEDEKILKYVIDNANDLECRNEVLSKPIHLICMYSTQKMIKYIINKEVDVECRNHVGYFPINMLIYNKKISRDEYDELMKLIKNKMIH